MPPPGLSSHKLRLTAFEPRSQPVFDGIAPSRTIANTKRLNDWPDYTTGALKMGKLLQPALWVRGDIQAMLSITIWTPDRWLS